MSDLNQLLFVIIRYIALTIFFIGSLVRYDRDQYTWKADSSQLLESKQLRRGSIPFHIGILAIFFGHFIGLLTPSEVWHFWVFRRRPNSLSLWLPVVYSGLSVFTVCAF